VHKKCNFSGNYLNNHYQILSKSGVNTSVKPKYRKQTDQIVRLEEQTARKSRDMSHH